MFEPVLSSSAMRAVASKDEMVSMADSLPPINFGFAELQSRISAFQEKFDVFIATSRERVLEERNQFRISLAKSEQEEKSKKREMETLQQKTADHQRTLAQQEQETDTLQAEIDELTAHREQAITRKAQLQAQLANLRVEVSSKERAQQKHGEALELQCRQNTPELDFWQSCLGLRIEGVPDKGQTMSDCLRFVFTNLRAQSTSSLQSTHLLQSDASFILEISKPEYSARDCRPKLEDEVVDANVAILNRNQDLGAFLKRMRSAFKSLDT